MADDPFQLERINYIVNYVIDPCDAPVTVYVQTAWPAFLKAIFTYFEFDWKQVLMGAVRPSRAIARQRGMKKGRRGYKGGRKPRPGILRRALGFDPWDTLGKFLGGFFDLPGRKVSAGVVTLWIVEGVIERLLFWFFILDLVTEFFYTWCSQVMMSQYCQNQLLSISMAEGAETLVGSFIEWNGFPAGPIVKQRGPLMWSPGGVAVPPGNWSLVASANFETLGGLPVPGRVVVFQDAIDDSRIVWDSDDWPPANDGDPFVAGGPVAGGHTYYVRAQISGVLVGVMVNQLAVVQGKWIF